MLAELDAQLSQSEWLCGGTYSLADVVWTAVLNRLEALAFNDLWEDNICPNLCAYFNHLKTRPSFEAVIQDDKMPLRMLLSGLSRILRG